MERILRGNGMNSRNERDQQKWNGISRDGMDPQELNGSPEMEKIFTAGMGFPEMGWIPRN